MTTIPSALHHLCGGFAPYEYDEGRVWLAIDRGGVRLTPPELCEAIRTLINRRRFSGRLTSRHLGASERTVQRHRRCPDGAHRGDGSWQPANPDDTPGALVPGEGDRPRRCDLSAGDAP